MSCSLGQMRSKSWNQTSGAIARYLKCSSSMYQCFQEQNIQKLAESLQANTLNTAPKPFPLKTIPDYCCKNVSWKEFKYKVAMETYFPGRICHLHLQVPVWLNTKTFPGSQFCRATEWIRKDLWPRKSWDCQLQRSRLPGPPRLASSWLNFSLDRHEAGVSKLVGAIASKCQGFWVSFDS